MLRYISLAVIAVSLVVQVFLFLNIRQQRAEVQSLHRAIAYACGAVDGINMEREQSGAQAATVPPYCAAEKKNAASRGFALRGDEA